MKAIVIGAIFVILTVAFWTWLLITAEPDPDEEPRDRTIGRDQYQPDRLTRLRALQTPPDTDIARKAHPVAPTHAEKRRQASGFITRGF